MEPERLEYDAPRKVVRSFFAHAPTPVGMVAECLHDPVEKAGDVDRRRSQDEGKIERHVRVVERFRVRPGERRDDARHRLQSGRQGFRRLGRARTDDSLQLGGVRTAPSARPGIERRELDELAPCSRRSRPLPLPLRSRGRRRGAAGRALSRWHGSDAREGPPRGSFQPRSPSTPRRRRARSSGAGRRRGRPSAPPRAAACSGGGNRRPCCGGSQQELADRRQCRCR